MNPTTLKDLFRSEMDDAEAPGNGDSSDSLWSDGDIFRYMDEAQREFARQTLCFADVVDVPVFADRKWVPISENIIEVREGVLESSGREVEPVHMQSVKNGVFEDDYGLFRRDRWRTMTGEPSYIVMDIREGYGRLVAIPTADNTIELSVYRLPEREVTSSSTRLEVTDLSDQRALLLWMRKLAYEKHDVMSQSQDMAMLYEQRFLAYCDEKKARQGRRRTGSRVVSYGGL